MFDTAGNREQAEKLVADFCDSPDGNSGAVFCAGLKVIITDNLKAIKNLCEEADSYLGFLSANPRDPSNLPRYRKKISSIELECLNLLDLTVGLIKAHNIVCEPEDLLSYPPNDCFSPEAELLTADDLRKPGWLKRKFRRLKKKNKRPEDCALAHWRRNQNTVWKTMTSWFRAPHSAACGTGSRRFQPANTRPAHRAG